MYLAVTSGALTLLCGQPSAKCWVTWLYSYDKNKKTWWAFWHQQMVPCPWLHVFLFFWVQCIVLACCALWLLFDISTLTLFKSFLGLWLCACLRAVHWKGTSHIISSTWQIFLFFPSSIKQKRLCSDIGLPWPFPFTFFYFVCLFSYGLLKFFCQKFLHDNFAKQNKFSIKESDFFHPLMLVCILPYSQKHTIF